MVIFIQLIILGLAVAGLGLMVGEIFRIYNNDGDNQGKTYILCIPETENLEKLCADTLSRFRRNGFGEDILIYGENLPEEEKNIGRLLESADNGIYFIGSEELKQIIK